MRELANEHYPAELDLLRDDQAERLLRMLEDAAECGALPGFEEDVETGTAVVEAWRERRFGTIGLGNRERVA